MIPSAIARGPAARWLRSERLATAAALIVVSAVVILPFARAHFAWRDLADAYIHLVRIYAVDAALASGDLYPRWLPDLYLGYGYPLLNFYAPATYYLGSLFHRLGATIYGSLQLLGALSVLLGASGAYALARALTAGSNTPTAGPRELTGGSRATALLAAGAYVLAPYPFLTNLYVRAALPEALALGLMPWTFLALFRALTHPDRLRIVPLALAIAALILTHNVTALTTLPFLCLFAALVIPSSARDQLASLRTSALGLAAALALSAFFWLPALVESRYVQLDLLGGGIYDYRTWLFNPLTGLADLTLTYDYSALDRAVPAKLSLVQLTLFAASLATALVRKRLSNALPWLSIALFCIFLNTTWSDALWSRLPLLPLTQFPWRFYGLASLAISLAAAVTLPHLPLLRRSPLLPFGAAAMLLFAFAGGSLARRPLLLAPDPPHDVDHRLLASEEYNKYGAGTTSGGEFLPHTAQWDEGPRDKRRGIRVYDELYPQISWQAGLARVLSGRAAVTGIRQAPNAIALDVDAAEPATIAIHQLLFPGWRAFLNGQPAALQSVPADPVRNVSLGFMTVSVPAGKHHLELRFASTGIRTLGAALSAATLAILIILSLQLPPPLFRLRLPLGSTSFVPLAVSASLAALLAVLLLELPARLGCCQLDVAPRVASDMSDALLGGKAQVVSPLGRATGTMPPYVDVRYLTLGADTRRWIFLHPPSEVSIPIRVPPRAYLQTALAIDPVAWEQTVGDGARFIAELETDGTRHIVLDRTLNPRARTEERRWVDVWVDLTAHAGREGRLILRTEPREELSFDWAGWAEPQVVAWHAARPVPSSPHPW